MSQASMTIVGVLRVLPAGAVIADVVLGALLEQHGLRLGERCGRFLRLPGRDGVEPLVEQLALLAGRSRASASVQVSTEPSPISRASGFPALLVCPLKRYRKIRLEPAVR